MFLMTVNPVQNSSAPSAEDIDPEVPAALSSSFLHPSIVMSSSNMHSSIVSDAEAANPLIIVGLKRYLTDYLSYNS